MAIPISNVPRRVVYAASGVGPYAFTFEVLAQTDVSVYEDDDLLTLTTDYTVTVNINGTGSVTLTSSPTGSQIAIVGSRAIQRTTDFVTGGDFFANSVNEELDSLTIFAQQNAEGVERAMKAPQTDTLGIDMTLPRASERAGKYLSFDSNGEPLAAEGRTEVAGVYAIRDQVLAVAAIDDEVVLVAAVDGEVATVSGIAANVTTVAGIAADVTAVAGVAANVTTVAGIAADVTSVAGDATDIGTVAGIAAAVSTVAGISSDVTTVAADGTDIGAVAAISADVQAVADIAADVSAVENIAANVTTVAGIDTEVTAVAGIAANVTTVAGVAADVTTVAGIDTEVTTLAGLETEIEALYAEIDDIATKVSKTSDTGSAVLPTGTDAQRDGSPSAGYMRFNTDQGSFEGYDGSAWGSIGGGLIYAGLFSKADPTIVAWTKTGAFTATAATTLYIEVNGTVHTIASGATITMPGSATTGTDYAIWCKTDGTLEATTNHTSPPSANARKVGGFHYAPGGNATGTSGGDTTPAINAYSMWDLKWRPACPDPRGMTLVAGGFWADIYLTGVDAITNGSSKYNVTMADGSSPPKVPTDFGGNGSTTYGSYTWFEAMELATAFGKKCPTQMEFMSLAYGTTEASSVGSDQVSTILNAAYTSKWGVMQSAGVLWVWARDRGGPAAAASWNANTEGRGSEYNAPNAGLLGGAWSNGSDSGSRCSAWNISASASDSSVGSRFVCDHLQLD